MYVLLNGLEIAMLSLNWPVLKIFIEMILIL